LTEITSERGWLDRIVRMEGTKEGPSNQKHRSASWDELISLALALEVTLYELVLPEDDEVQVIVAKASKVDPLPDLPDGTARSTEWSYAHYSDRDELSHLLFGLPGSSLTVDNLQKLAEMFHTGATEARIDIEQVQDGLEKALASIEAFKKEQENN